MGAPYASLWTHYRVLELRDIGIIERESIACVLYLNCIAPNISRIGYLVREHGVYITIDTLVLIRAIDVYSRDSCKGSVRQVKC
jgi:hypothetical protein